MTRLGLWTVIYETLIGIAMAVLGFSHLPSPEAFDWIVAGLDFAVTVSAFAAAGFILITELSDAKQREREHGDLSG